MWTKSKGLFFAVFGLFFQNEISGKKCTKGKGYSLTFLLFWPLFQK
jgi:hypothetical protein